MPVLLPVDALLCVALASTALCVYCDSEGVGAPLLTPLWWACCGVASAGAGTGEEEEDEDDEVSESDADDVVVELSCTIAADVVSEVLVAEVELEDWTACSRARVAL